MKESIGSTASLNIIFAFLAIIFAFLAGTLSYYKAYKVNNVIVNSIEKFEGYNNLSKDEINIALSNLGYQRFNNDCGSYIYYGNNKYQNVKSSDGICVYMRVDKNKKTYQYLVISYMTINLPIISDFIKMPVKTTSKELYGCYGSNRGFVVYDGNVSCN